MKLVCPLKLHHNNKKQIIQLIIIILHDHTQKLHEKHLQPALNIKPATITNSKQLANAKPNCAQPYYIYTNTAQPILNTPNTTIST